jgi:hypothetical protein
MIALRKDAIFENTLPRDFIRIEALQFGAPFFLGSPFDAPLRRGGAHESAKGTVRPLRVDPNLARVRFAARLD